MLLLHTLSLLGPHLSIINAWRLVDCVPYSFNCFWRTYPSTKNGNAMLVDSVHLGGFSVLRHTAQCRWGHTLKCKYCKGYVFCYRYHNCSIRSLFVFSS